MPKRKNISGRVLHFDVEGKEKILLPDHSYELPDNSYIEGLIEGGMLKDVAATPEAQSEPQTNRQ